MGHSCRACSINLVDLSAELIDLSAMHGTIVESCGPICQPSVACRVIDKLCGPIYLPITAKGLKSGLIIYEYQQSDHRLFP